MSRRTRRVVMLGLAVAVITVPWDMFVLGVLSADPNLPTAQAWVARMTPAERDVAALRVAEYPQEYRGALLSALDPVGRARVWRRTVDKYVAEHPNLTSEASLALSRVRALAVADTFKEPGRYRPQLQAVSEDVLRLLGPSASRFLFKTAGANNQAGSRAALPLRVRLEAYLHDRSLNAMAPWCNCSHDYIPDCAGWYCSQLQGCAWRFIGCGLWYESACDGYCMKDPD